MKKCNYASIVVVLFAAAAAWSLPQDPKEPFTNSIGMKLISIPAGRFMMGEPRGAGWEKVERLDRRSAERWLDATTHTDWDEVPVHEVFISQSFRVSATEVTNAQFERFDPGHSKWRGHRGFSRDDDEAVVFVTWNEAVGFADWLSKEEGRKYRLPTEAEWEYACRAGTTTPFSNGIAIPSEMIEMQALRVSRERQTVSLQVGRFGANPWGIFDMHGNVEEWCLDWYGPYVDGPQINPSGPVQGCFRVTRGGSHNSPTPYLRSANRIATLPDDRSALIGFRLVLGEPPQAPSSQAVPKPLFLQDVSREPAKWNTLEPRKPIFMEPIPFVIAPATGFIGWHNHQPSISWAPNGDLLVAFFSTHREAGREMVIMGSRLRRGRKGWDPASPIFYAADRNVTGCSIFQDSKGRIRLLNGLDEGQYWSHLAIVERASTDSGASWSPLRLAHPEHGLRNQLIHGMIETRQGWLFQLCDAVPGQDGGSAVLLSRDQGRTWTDLGEGQPAPSFKSGASGAWIAGIHARMVELKDSSLLAIGRGDPIDGRITESRSTDQGKTWTYAPTPFPAIRGGQRAVLRRLREGPLLLISFTDPLDAYMNPFSDVERLKGEKAFRVSPKMISALKADGVPAEVLARLESLRREIIRGRERARALVIEHLGPQFSLSWADRVLARLDTWQPEGMTVRDAAGKERRIYGMFAALSFDEGKSWPVIRLLTPGGPARTLHVYGWAERCVIDDEHAEIAGYLADTQTPDGVIHLISSGLHYRFNLAWLQRPMPARRP